jgi:RNase H-like domain found in reverse transcriptase
MSRHGYARRRKLDYTRENALLQQDPTTKWSHPVVYDGRKLSPTETNYTVHEEEFLAIKYALQTTPLH